MDAASVVEPEFVLSADGTPIAVWRSGAGPPLLLVHGTTADHTRWAPVLPAFEAEYSVLALDRRGRGRSGDAASYEFEREFEDVAAVIEWAADGVFVLGHSYGGICALEAARLTTNVEKLVLYEPPLGFVSSAPDVVRRLETLRETGEHDELVRYFMLAVVGLAPDQVEHLRSLPAWKARVAAAGTIPREERANREYDFSPEHFREVGTPTLFLLGGESPEPFRQACKAVHATLQNCRVVVLEGQRHNAMDTATERFTTEVLRFLRTA
jgi:pimeloyl-ACP methyl ester carboxylesterase